MSRKLKRRKINKTKKFSTRKKLFLLFCLLFIVSSFFFLFWDLPSPDKISSSSQISTKILDRNGKIIYEIYTEENRTPIKLEDLPDYVKWAAISAEDKDFYNHHGFSIPGMIRASLNIVFRQKLQGGSTITQQLIKSALLTSERTVRRKIRESVLTLVVETKYSKDQILEMYLNQVPYGGTAWGIESAARTYFGKSAKDLSLPESALLAGLTASPTRYSPFGAQPELATERKNWVLDQMVNDKHLSKDEAQKAKDQEMTFASLGNRIEAPHFAMYVKDWLVEKYGQKMVEQGGLKVTTTLDLDIQDFAQTAVASEVAKLKSANVTNGAAIVTNPKTGEILAMVGSKDYFAKDIPGNYNVTTALRQPGSSIKPVNYALGLLNKTITLATAFNDEPTCFRVSGQPDYCPGNYDNTFRGPIQTRFALGNSINIPAVKILALNSLEEFIPFAQKMGLSTLQDPKKYGLSLTLGGGEVRMTDMAVAFGTFANQGKKQNLVSILKVEDSLGKVYEETKIPDGEEILPVEVTYLISHTLLDNGARSAAFGSSSFLVVKNHPEVSVKTGTTNDKRDNWTIGYNPSYLVAVWVGNNNNKSMSAVASGVTGASPIWNKIMSFVLKDAKQEWPSKPEAIVGASICNVSGKLPNPGSPCDTRFEYFLKGTVPTETENLKTQVEIDKTTGQLANDKTLPENKEMQEKSIITDPLNTRWCLDCAVQTNPIIINYQKLQDQLMLIKQSNNPTVTP